MYEIIKKLFVVFFLCISCTTSRRTFFDGLGTREVRENIGRIEGMQQTVENSTDLIESYSSNLEGGIDRERELIEELTNIIRRIRERGDGKTKDTRTRDLFIEFCFGKM